MQSSTRFRREQSEWTRCEDHERLVSADKLHIFQAASRVDREDASAEPEEQAVDSRRAKRVYCEEESRHVCLGDLKR